MFDNQAVFNNLIEHAKNKWAPNGKWDIRPLEPGFSGAQVLKVELVQKGRAAVIDGGHYILKLCEEDPWGGDPEPSRFNTAKNTSDQHDPTFFHQHIPKLCQQEFIEAEGKKYFAILMHVAGHSFDLYQPAEGPENQLFQEAAQVIVEQTMAAWTLPEPETELLLPHQYLESWMGYRLQESEAAGLHSFVGNFTEKRTLFISGAETLLNPFKLYQILQTNAMVMQSRRPLTGVLHGDLHGGNIFVHNASPTDKPFQIIDFGRSVIGYVGFDQAYLETAQCLYNMRDHDPMLLIHVLKSVDSGENHLPPTYNARGAWLHNCLVKMRTGWRIWQEKHHPTRPDELARQMLLARVAAGINWANKPILDHERTIALIYAAWAARHYLESREPELWKSVATGKVDGTSMTIQLPDYQFTDLWRMFWSQVDGFSNKDLCYVLVAGGHETMPELKAYGNIPWSVVIDLDPYSDQSGLFKAVEPVIRTRRGLHVLSDDSAIGEFRHATYWLLTAGWRAKGEEPLDYWQWLEHKVPIIQGVFGKLKKSFGADKIVMVFVPWISYDKDQPMVRFSAIANHAFTILGNQGRIILTGSSHLNMTYPNVTHIPIAQNAIAPALANSFGTMPSQLRYEIPGSSGMVPIPVETLRMLQESLVILHSSILQEGTAPDPGQENGFWRGHPPTWNEIDATIDIPRSVTIDVIKKVNEYLKTPPSRTVFISQRPGMGGTTVLRRVAWELSRTCPVAFIKRYAPSLPQRLKTLHALAGRSILVIIEGSCLTEAQFEDLFNTAFKDNIRSVFIYLRKDFSNHLPVGDGKGDYLFLPDPLDEEEAKLFLSRFRKLTEDDGRLAELQKITNMEQYVRYRIPFFYGLITFERNFNGIDHFVQQHLQGLNHRLVGLYQYLAIVTCYTSEGLPASFVNHFLRVEPWLELREILPEGPCRLIISSDKRLRLLHPLIAEQVLETLEPGGVGEQWIQSLYSISLDLIGRLHEYSPNLNQVIHDLLTALFINRQGASLLPSELDTCSYQVGGRDSDKVARSHHSPDRYLSSEDGTIREPAEDREYFSPIIMKMIGVHKQQARQVFDELIKKYPEDPHFWNHRGRYYMYKIQDLSIAEESLLKAIELSNQRDIVHLHTYGLVKKRQVSNQLVKINGTPTPQEVFQIVGPNYLAAEEAFRNARDLSPENSYSFISHIQMILDVLNRIRTLSGNQIVTQTDPTSQRLVMDRIGQINDMIDSIHQIFFSSSKQREYIDGFEANLRKLYGDMQGVIRLWERVLASGSVTPHARRALCKAYLARKDGDWSKLEKAELQRIMNVSKENLSGAHWRDNDILLWFQAANRLPDQDRNAMIAQLSDWQSRPLWSVSYLMSILQFLEWLDNRDGADREVVKAIERCRGLVYGRKRYCRFYFGTGPGALPLLDVSELVRDQKNKWFEDDRAMKRLNGRISEDLPSDDSPPHVIIDGIFRIPFFNEGGFKKFQDENVAVSFFLGFSPTGMRAFKVERGAIAEGTKQNLAIDLALRREAINLNAKLADPKWVARQIEVLTLIQVQDLARGLVNARSQWGAQITVAQLQDLIEAILGIGDLPNRLGFKDFGTLLQSFGIFTFEHHDDYCYLSLVMDTKEEKAQAAYEENSLIGTVIYINSRHHLGFIRVQAEAGTADYRFSPINAPMDINKGDRVSFVPYTREGKLVAKEVRPANQSSNEKKAPIGVHLLAKPQKHHSKN